MGLFDGNKTELQEKILELSKDLAVKEELLSQKTEEVEHLRKQVDKLQDAVLATSHPDAYRQLKDDELTAMAIDEVEPLDPETRKRAEEEAKLKRNLLNSIESPLFNSVEDVDNVMDALSRRMGVPEDPSIHDNSES